MLDFKKTVKVIIFLLLFMLFFFLNYKKINNKEGKSHSQVQKDEGQIEIERKSISKIRKEYVLIIFFSMDCGLCHKTILEAERLHEKFGDKIEIVGITRDNISGIKYKIKFPILYDKFAKYHKKFRIKILPYRILVKSDKIIYEDDLYKKIPERGQELDKILRKL